MKLVLKKTKLRSFFKKLALLAVIVLPVSVNAQKLDWVKQMGGTNYDEGYSIAVDGAGNVYTTGTFSGTADFDPGAGTFSLTSAGNNDIFISKLDASGNFVWVKQIGGTGDDTDYSIATDGIGNVYTTGSFQGTVDFDPGAGTVNLTSAGGADIFINKLDASGNFVWAKKMGTFADDKAYSITIDGAGNVYTTGSFQGTVDFNPGAGTFNLTSAGNGDVFISKLDASGNFVWANKMGGTSYETDYSIATDGSGNVYTTGIFYGTEDFDPGAGTVILTSAGMSDIFISKLDASGNFVWAKQMGGTGFDYGYSITTDGSGNIYATGFFNGTVDFDPGAGIVNLTAAGSADIFISKLDASGNFVWAKKMGGTNSEVAYSISIDGTGNIYTTGHFGGTADFDPGVGTFNFTPVGGSNSFISKLDASGNFVWAKQMKGAINQGKSVAIDGAGNIYTTGSFQGTTDFNPGAGTFNLTSAGSSDAFVLKLIPCVSNTGTDVISACGSHTWIDGITYTASNSTATKTLTNAYGCDSIVTLNLTIKNSNTGTDVISACNSHTWINGITYTVSNSTATHTLSNVAGCDSIVTLNLTIKNSNTGTDVISACNSHTWIDGITYTASNSTATKTLTNVAGCDSIVTLNLTIKNSNTGTDVISACNSHTWIDGITYTASNSTATKTLTNVAGCDSIVTLNLTIKNSNTGTDIISACNSHTWIDGITYTASNNTATHTLTNVAGCDSIVTLNLTIKNSNTGTDVISACNSHTWIDGITYTASNSTATHTLTNVAGCDSIVTLNLTIKNSNTGTDVISACNSHTWIDGITYTASNSTATHTLTNVAGCDSIVTLNLTIKNSTTGTDVISACNSHTWIDGITYTSSNSTATKTLTNVAGCDSIVTLNLTINSSPTLTFAISADTVCVNNAPVSLLANPTGGTFSGQGVSGNMFDPAAVTGSSYVVITYSYTDGNTCSNTAKDSIYVSGCVGLKNYSINHEVKVYPNPTEGNITIDLGTTESSVKLVVKNELGQLVSQATYSTTSVIHFNLQEKAGIYFIEITTDSGNTGHFKLIKQ